MTSSKRRVAITGIGIVSPAGNDVPTFWSHLLSGQSGVSLITDFPTDKLRSDVSASVRGFPADRFFSPKETEIHGKVTQFSLGAAFEAMRSAGLEALYRPPKRGARTRTRTTTARATRGRPAIRTAACGCRRGASCRRGRAPST